MNLMGAHVTPPNRLRKLLVKDNSTRNEEAAVISTSCVGVDVIFVFTYGRDAGKIFGKCRKPHPRGAVHPAFYGSLTVQTRFLASTPNPWLASSSDSCFIAFGR